MKKVFHIFLFLPLFILTLQAQSFRIEVEDLAQNLNKYKVLDVRDQETFSYGHIKDALNFPINLTYEDKALNGKITTPVKMQKLLRELGLDTNDKIVIYDNGSFFDASRLFWVLEVYGFKDLKLLNASFEDWDELNLPISTITVQTTPSNYVASIDNKKLATKFTTQIATKSPNQTIIDARDYKAYIGEKSSAKRYGHIPKAIHIPATHNISSNKVLSRLKSFAELQKVYKDVNKDKKVIIYCAIGRISSTNYFAMRELGYDVANYDASWKEWGNDFNLPITNRSQGSH